MNLLKFTSKFSTYANGNPKELYKYLIRQCRKLPCGPREHYQFMIRQSFKQHVNEKDQERIEQITNRAYEDADWILTKYLDKKDS